MQKTNPYTYLIMLTIGFVLFIYGNESYLLNGDRLSFDVGLAGILVFLFGIGGAYNIACEQVFINRHKQSKDQQVGE